MSDQDNQPQLTAPVESQPQQVDDTSGIKLDLSKSIPVGDPQAAPIKLDISKSIPVAAPQDNNPVRGAAEATSMGGRPNDFHSWIQDVQGDVKNGTKSTWVGSLLGKFGAKGTNYGNSEAIGDFMAGPALGVPKALEGANEIKNAENVNQAIVGG